MKSRSTKVGSWLAALLLTLLVLPQHSEAAVNCSILTPGLNDALINGAWQQLQIERAQVGGQPLIWNDTLATSAQWMARDASIRKNVTTTVDSFGRDVQVRLNHCDFFAQGAESLRAFPDTLSNNPQSVWLVWKNGDTSRLYTILLDSNYRLAALGRFRAGNADYWVLDAGYLAITTPTMQATPQPSSTRTPVPATAVPTATSVPPTPVQPTSTPYLIGEGCFITEGDLPGPFDFGCTR